MGLIKKILSQSFDKLYHLVVIKKTCNKILEHDLFDGKEYSIDQFFNTHQKYFDAPEEYYKDFAYEGGLNLTDGHNFNAKDFSDEAKYGYQPMLFNSPITTEWDETNLVPFKWFKNKGKKSNTILLFSPGWTRPNLRAEKAFCKRLLDQGIDSGLMTKPYHQERAPGGSYSGEYFISGNVFWTAMNFRHYVAETRLLIQFMRIHYEYVGIIGMSSGGFQAGLAIGVEPVDFYFPFITGAELGSIVWESLIGIYLKIDLEKKGITKEEINKAWAIGDQLFLGHNIQAKYMKQYISLYDQVVPTKYQYKLWEIYKKPEFMELECAHSSVFYLMSAVADDIVKFINEKLSGKNLTPKTP